MTCGKVEILKSTVRREHNGSNIHNVGQDFNNMKNFRLKMVSTSKTENIFEGNISHSIFICIYVDITKNSILNTLEFLCLCSTSYISNFRNTNSKCICLIYKNG